MRRRSKTLHHELPLFADPHPADPSRVWEGLDAAARERIVERLASLLGAYAKADPCPSVSPAHSTHGVKTP